MHQDWIAKFKESTGRLPSQVEMSKKLGISPQKAVSELMAYLKPVVIVEPGNESLSHAEIKEPVAPRTGFLAVGLFVVAAITFVLSIYFTALWFSSMFNLAIAGAISVSMVSYMVLSPQVAASVRGVVKLPLWVSFTIALVFSMGSTVAGQYNQLTESVDFEAVSERAVLDILRAEENELLGAIQTAREQQAYHQETLEKLTGTAEERMENQAYAATERFKVMELADQIEAREARLIEVREEILSEIQSGNIGVTEERSDFYSWLAVLFGITREQMEFWIAALPAVFIDIIAALSLNLALSVGRGDSRRTGTTPEGTS